MHKYSAATVCELFPLRCVWWTGPDVEWLYHVIVTTVVCKSKRQL